MLQSCGLLVRMHAVCGCTVPLWRALLSRQCCQLVNHLFDAQGAACHNGHIVTRSSDFWTRNKSTLNLIKWLIRRDSWMAQTSVTSERCLKRCCSFGSSCNHMGGTMNLPQDYNNKTPSKNKAYSLSKSPPTWGPVFSCVCWLVDRNGGKNP